MQLRLCDAPMTALTELTLDDANELLVAWGHKLGACHRPFTVKAYCVELDGKPISLSISASTVTASLAGGILSRGEVVEQARLCTAPGHRWATPVMMRLWREVCARRWPDWPVRAAVAYQQNDGYTGGIYRWDGWIKVTDDAGAKRPMLNHGREAYATKPEAYGSKTLWCWPFDDGIREALKGGAL